MVIDLPGMGQSPVPNGTYDLNYLTQHILAIAPEHAIWLGWSLGGLITTHIAAHHPDRVNAFRTIATNLSFTQHIDWPCAIKPTIFDHFKTLFSIMASLGMALASH